MDFIRKEIITQSNSSEWIKYKFPIQVELFTIQEKVLQQYFFIKRIKSNNKITWTQNIHDGGWLIIKDGFYEEEYQKKVRILKLNRINGF